MTRPTPPLVTIAEAAAEAGVTVDVIVDELAAGKRRAYGRRRGVGLLDPIPRNHFSEPLSRLPPGVRYATKAEMSRLMEEQSALKGGRATETQMGEWWEGRFAHLPAGVVASDYVEQEEDYAHAFYVAPRLVDTWFEAEAAIIYADGKPEWADIRVESLTHATSMPRDVNRRRPGHAESKRGRKPYDWKTIEATVGDLMDYNGDFGPDQPEWNCQERLIEQITDRLGIGKSQLAKNLPAMLDRWRVRKSGN
jgi:hypothetical protein